LATLWATPAWAGIGDPFNGIDVSLIDKSTGSAGLMLQISPTPVTGNVGPGFYGAAAELNLPAGIMAGGGFGSTSNDIEDEQFIANFEATVSNLGGTLILGGSPSGGFGGALPLSGTWRALTLAGSTLFEFPLSAIGITGTAPVTVPHLLGGVVTISGQGWGTGAVTLGGIATPLGGTTAVAAAGTDQRTVGGLGVLQLVTPVKIQTQFGAMAMILGLNLTVVPEPGSVSLIAVGVAGLALLGVDRRRANAAG